MIVIIIMLMFIDKFMLILFNESVAERKIRLEKERREMAECWNISSLGENK